MGHSRSILARVTSKDLVNLAAHPLADSVNSTGYGQHADYVFGWKGTALQTAMDGGCFGATCMDLKTQEFPNANKCSVKDTVNEPIEGCKYLYYPARFMYHILMWPLGLDKLPGDGSGA